MKSIKMKQILLVLPFVLLVASQVNSENKTFVATKEWQEIKDGKDFVFELRLLKGFNLIFLLHLGQEVPRGLHIRINLTTGKKEGKILEDSDTNATLSLKASDQSSALSIAETNDELDPLSPEEEMRESKRRLEEALKNIPDESLPYSEDELKEVVKKYRSYETLKKDFKEIDMSMKSDFELLADLFTKFESLTDDIDNDEINTLFEDLDYLVHQIDNANEFIRAGGMEKIILPNIQNQTNAIMKVQSIKLLGTLVQNNPKAQIIAFEKNTGFLLMQILAQSSNSKEISAALFALGGLVRRFPIAQNELLNKPGLKVLVSLLGRNVDYKNKIKLLVLLTDLLREFQETKDYSAELDAEKKRQYQTVDLVNRLRSTEYCGAIEELMTENRHDYLTDSYALQDIVDILNESRVTCQSSWSESPLLRHTLLVIKNKFDNELKHEKADDEDLVTVMRGLNSLNEFLYNNTDTANLI